MPPAESALTYCFEGFELQPAERRLLVGGAPTALGPRAFDLLVALVERAGQLVPKDTLLERVWPDLVVEENNLQVQISTLRKLLGQDSITTVVGKGYRFNRELAGKAATVIHVPRSLLSDQTNIPHNLGALIGRERELTQLQALLAAGRLVTVAGPGGVGKTRLMIGCALGLVNRYADGVWLIELANENDPDRVAAAVAITLRVQVKDSSSAGAELSRHLRDKHMLLLLDNCEHLVDAVASLVDSLLAVAPQLQILTSSQDVLGLSCEQVFRAPSLQLPTEASPSAAAALSCGAIRLFEERARLGDLSFRCDDQNAPVITAICQRLDGIPLAIEMAAARVATLGLESLSQMLDERFLALSAGRRSAVPRQRTLQATFDWSFNLLAERERVVFRRLSGFVGGFSLAAAIAVASDTDLDQNEVIDSITVLVTKSLLTVDSSQGQWRYRLLEVARAYALEKLADADEAGIVARRSAEHYRLVFRTCFDDWTRLSDDAFEARYAPDMENLRMALDWSFGPDGDPQIGLALTGLSGHLWIGSLMLAESEHRFATAFANLETDTPIELEAHLQLVAGAFFYWRLNEKAVVALRRAVTTLRDLGEVNGTSYALLLLGSVLAVTGDEKAEETLEQARALLINSDRPRLLALLPKSFSLLHQVRGLTEEAARETAHALALARAGGYEILALTLQENFADALWLAGDLAQALATARDVIEQCKRVKVSHKIGWGWVYGNLFGILTESGALAEAVDVGRIAMPYLREASSTWILMDHYALRLAKAGNAKEAALVHGWINEKFIRMGVLRQPNELRAMNSTVSLLRAQLPAEVLARFCTEGSLLDEEKICQLAVT